GCYMSPARCILGGFLLHDGVPVPICLITFWLPTGLVILHVLLSAARSYGAPQRWLQSNARWHDPGSSRRAPSCPLNQNPCWLGPPLFPNDLLAAL
uniref:Uncharacterized protein n=1 Tax=Apteryx owenii TaxID=8824 RepID=A0A8B9PPX8_APTOW